MDATTGTRRESPAATPATSSPPNQASPGSAAASRSGISYARPLGAPLNGIDTPVLLALRETMRTHKERAAFHARAVNRWQRGRHSRTLIYGVSPPGEDEGRARAFAFDADHPAALAGRDLGPTPVECLLHALGACLTGGVATVAAERGISLRDVETTIDADDDLRAEYGIVCDRPEGNGASGLRVVRVVLRIRGLAPPEVLHEIAGQARARSPVLDVVARGTRVQLTVDAA